MSSSWFIPESIGTLEAVAAIAMLQNTHEIAGISTASLRWKNLYHLAGFQEIATEPDTREPAFVELVTDDWMLQYPGLSYVEVLASLSDVPMRLLQDRRTALDVALGIGSREVSHALRFPEITAQSPGHGIVLCPFAARAELQLPVATWVAVVRLLKTYGEPLYVLGEPGERFDAAMFNENEILSEATQFVKLQALSGARLVVGAVNAWTWTATAWDKKLVYFYPDAVPPRRWFPWSSENFGRCNFEPASQTFVLLASLRALIADL